MWWLIGIWILNVILMSWDLPKYFPKSKIARFADRCFGAISVVSFLVIILWIVGWVWYYLCGGFMVTVEDSFFMKIIDGLIAFIPLGFLIGVVAICCGWNPDK